MIVRLSQKASLDASCACGRKVLVRTSLAKVLNHLKRKHDRRQKLPVRGAWLLFPVQSHPPRARNGKPIAVAVGPSTRQSHPTQMGPLIYDLHPPTQATSAHRCGLCGRCNSVESCESETTNWPRLSQAYTLKPLPHARQAKKRKHSVALSANWWAAMSPFLPFLQSKCLANNSSVGACSRIRHG